MVMISPTLSCSIIVLFMSIWADPGEWNVREQWWELLGNLFHILWNNGLEGTTGLSCWTLVCLLCDCLNFHIHLGPMGQTWADKRNAANEKGKHPQYWPCHCYCKSELASGKTFKFPVMSDDKHLLFKALLVMCFVNCNWILTDIQLSGFLTYLFKQKLGKGVLLYFCIWCWPNCHFRHKEIEAQSNVLP